MEEYIPTPEDGISEQTANERTVTKLIERAIDGKHSNFEFLKSWAERDVAMAWKSSSRKLAKSFLISAKRTMKEYLLSVAKDQEDPTRLMGYRDMMTCYKFYIGEARLAADMLNEYYCYISHGHVMDTLLGVQRSEEDLYDFRNMYR